MQIPTTLKSGDIVNVWWVDIYEDGTGDPAQAQLKDRGPVIAYYYGNRRSHGMLCGVFCYSWEEDEDLREAQGFVIIPWRMITKVRKLR